MLRGGSFDLSQLSGRGSLCHRLSVAERLFPCKSGSFNSRFNRRGVLCRPGSWQGPQTEASFLPGVWSLIYLFSLCHSSLSPLPVLSSP